jgi:hypothetical protein
MPIHPKFESRDGFNLAAERTLGKMANQRTDFDNEPALSAAKALDGWKRLKKGH